MTEREWLAITDYDLKDGELLKLNLKFYGKGTDQSRRDLLKRINNEHCPKERNGKAEGHLKLTMTRLAKIMSGEEYNSHIVRAIIADGEAAE